MRSPLLYSSPNTSPATLIDGARHPVWVLNSRHIERASIIRWQGICEVAPPTLLLARNPRVAEQRYTPSTSTRACYELGRKSHRNADSTVGLVPSRSLFSAFLSCF